MACKRIVNAFLERTYQPGMAAYDLYTRYVSFGEDPLHHSSAVRFSVWDYACSDRYKGGPVIA